MSQEFGNETDVNQIKQQIQQAEAKKMQASGSTNSMSQEFGNETDVNEIRQQIQQAEANKKICVWSIFKRKQYKVNLLIIHNRQPLPVVFIFFFIKASLKVKMKTEEMSKWLLFYYDKFISSYILYFRTTRPS